MQCYSVLGTFIAVLSDCLDYMLNGLLHTKAITLSYVSITWPHLTYILFKNISLFFSLCRLNMPVFYLSFNPIQKSKRHPPLQKLWLLYVGCEKLNMFCNIIMMTCIYSSFCLVNQTFLQYTWKLILCLNSRE